MKYIILLLIISNSIFSQNKAIVPVSGTIVFVKEEKIFDKDLYIKSFKELLPKMTKAVEEQVVLERLAEGKATDPNQLKIETNKIVQTFEMVLPMILEEKRKVVRFHHEFKNDTIIKYTTADDQVFDSEITINRVTGIVTNEFSEYVEMEPNEIIKLTEFKNETKLVNGYKCFKVIYSYTNPQKSDFDLLSNIVSNSRELWVTEEIKCKYHPVIIESEIIEKYYPLEIIEYAEELKGSITTYKVEKIELN